MTEMKPKAYFLPTPQDYIELDKHAYLGADYKHHSLNYGPCMWIVTTKVVKIHEDGFETKNTRYIRRQVDQKGAII